MPFAGLSWPSFMSRVRDECGDRDAIKCDGVIVPVLHASMGAKSSVPKITAQDRAILEFVQTIHAAGSL